MFSKRIKCPREERSIQPEYERTLHVGSVKENFILSCIRGDKITVKKLITENYQVNDKDINGDTPLHYSAECGKLKIVKLLIRDGNAQVNSQNHFQYTPLIRAVVNDHATIVSFLLKSNAQLNLQDINGFTALHWAVFNKNPIIVRELIKEKANINAESKTGLCPIHLLFVNKNSDPDSLKANTITELLIENKADLNRSTNEYKNSALHFACQHSQEFIIDLLLKNDANPNAMDDCKETPLHIASKLNSTRVVEMLLAANANPTIRNKDRKTPIHLATDEEIKVYLLKTKQELFIFDADWCILQKLENSPTTPAPTATKTSVSSSKLSEPPEVEVSDHRHSIKPLMNKLVGKFKFLEKFHPHEEIRHQSAYELNMNFSKPRTSSASSIKTGKLFDLDIPQHSLNSSAPHSSEIDILTASFDDLISSDPDPSLSSANNPSSNATLPYSTLFSDIQRNGSDIQSPLFSPTSPSPILSASHSRSHSVPSASSNDPDSLKSPIMSPSSSYSCLSSLFAQPSITSPIMSPSSSYNSLSSLLERPISLTNPTSPVLSPSSSHNSLSSILDQSQHIPIPSSAFPLSPILSPSKQPSLNGSSSHLLKTHSTPDYSAFDSLPSHMSYPATRPDSKSSLPSSTSHNSSVDQQSSRYSLPISISSRSANPDSKYALVSSSLEHDTHVPDSAQHEDQSTLLSALLSPRASDLPKSSFLDEFSVGTSIPRRRPARQSSPKFVNPLISEDGSSALLTDESLAPPIFPKRKNSNSTEELPPPLVPFSPFYFSSGSSSESSEGPLLASQENSMNPESESNLLDMLKKANSQTLLSTGSTKSPFRNTVNHPIIPEPAVTKKSAFRQSTSAIPDISTAPPLERHLTFSHDEINRREKQPLHNKLAASMPDVNELEGSDEEDEIDERIVVLLKELGLSKYITKFIEEEWDWEGLLEITSADLISLGLKSGSRRKILSAVERHKKAAAAPPPSPHRAKPYEIEFNSLVINNFVGKGFYGEVYLGQWNNINVAIKKLSRPLEDIKKWLDEVELLYRLRHPNIVTFYSACLTSPNYCIVLEYCSRGTLEKLLCDPIVQFPHSRRISIALDVARGMHYLHSQDPPVIHRDLRSDNILLDENWRAKVSDFGLSRYKDGVYSYVKATTPFDVTISPPEVLETNHISEKADVYAFSLIMWELYTRTRPFKTMNPQWVANRVTYDKMRPPLDDTENWSKPYVDLMVQCWDHNYRSRPYFDEILRRLEQIHIFEIEKPAASPSGYIETKAPPLNVNLCT